MLFRTIAFAIGIALAAAGCDMSSAQAEGDFRAALERDHVQPHDHALNRYKLGQEVCSNLDANPNISLEYFRISQMRDGAAQMFSAADGQTFVDDAVATLCPSHKK